MKRTVLMSITTILIVSVTLSCQLTSNNPQDRTPPGTETPQLIPSPAETIWTTQASPTIDPGSNGPADAAGGHAITKETIPNLVVSAEVPLSEWAENILWPAENLEIPGYSGQMPDLLIQSGPALYPVDIQSAGLGQPVYLPLNGNQLRAISPDASSLVVKDPSQTGVYTVGGQNLWLVTKPAQIYGAVYSSDGRYLALTSAEEWSVTVYEVGSGTEIATLTGFETAAPIYSVIPAPGGEAVAWMARATLRIQDTASGALREPLQFVEFITSIDFSPDGNYVVLVAGDQLMVYDTQTGSQVSSVTMVEPARGLAISPDSKVVAVLIQLGIQFFDLQTLAPVSIIPLPVSMIKAAFSPDNQTIVSTGEDQKLYILQVP